jgi:hypothetical protein
MNEHLLQAINPTLFPTQLHELTDERKREMARKWAMLGERQKQFYCREETKDKERYI